MENIPKAEQLTRRERAIEFGRELLDQLLQQAEIYNGYPSEREQRRAGIQKLEDFANKPKGNNIDN
jgi:hypothetical protein